MPLCALAVTNKVLADSQNHYVNTKPQSPVLPPRNLKPKIVPTLGGNTNGGGTSQQAPTSKSAAPVAPVEDGTHYESYQNSQLKKASLVKPADQQPPPLPKARTMTSSGPPVPDADCVGVLERVILAISLEQARRAPQAGGRAEEADTWAGLGVVDNVLCLNFFAEQHAEQRAAHATRRARRAGLLAADGCECAERQGQAPRAGAAGAARL